MNRREGWNNTHREAQPSCHDSRTCTHESKTFLCRSFHHETYYTFRKEGFSLFFFLAPEEALLSNFIFAAIFAAHERPQNRPFPQRAAMPHISHAGSASDKRGRGMFNILGIAMSSAALYPLLARTLYRQSWEQYLPVP
mmetsp:Transcript_30530/g.58837  ORF Transcript_30530/g.58837 Transcript_30530/m.58837 type:complete len:139 (-) Transcript_30530:664-1080(-)